MRNILLHLLLSFALIFQGMAAACASGMKAGETGSMVNSGQGMAMQADASADGCKACLRCPDQHNIGHGSACAPGCAAASAVLAFPTVVPQAGSGGALVPAPRRSLVDFLQPPPTPPPIA